jgi:UDP-N-acetylmuramate-alanine ligase
VRRGDIVLTIGAGDVTKTGPELLQRLQGDA